MVYCEALQCFEAVFHLYELFVLRQICRGVNDCPGSTFLECLQGKSVAVKVFALEGKEYLAAFYAAAIRGHAVSTITVFFVEFLHMKLFCTGTSESAFSSS